MNIKLLSEKCNGIVEEVSSIVIGKRNLLKYVILGFLADGHILFEDYPGLAKTLMVKTLSECLNANFVRLQFTPDLLPADVIGTLIFMLKERSNISLLSV